MDYETYIGLFNFPANVGKHVGDKIYRNILYTMNKIEQSMMLEDSPFGHTYSTYKNEMLETPHKKVRLSDGTIKKNNNGVEIALKRISIVNVSAKTRLIYFIRCAIYEASTFGDINSSQPRSDLLNHTSNSDTNDCPVTPFLIGIWDKYSDNLSKTHINDHGVKTYIHGEINKIIKDGPLVDIVAEHISVFIRLFSRYMGNLAWAKLVASSTTTTTSGELLLSFILQLNSELSNKYQLNPAFIPQWTAYDAHINSKDFKSKNTNSVKVEQADFDDLKMMANTDPIGVVDVDISIDDITCGIVNLSTEDDVNIVDENANENDDIVDDNADESDNVVDESDDDVNIVDESDDADEDEE